MADIKMITIIYRQYTYIKPIPETYIINLFELKIKSLKILESNLYRLEDVDPESKRVYLQEQYKIGSKIKRKDSKICILSSDRRFWRRRGIGKDNNIGKRIHRQKSEDIIIKSCQCNDHTFLYFPDFSIDDKIIFIVNFGQLIL